MKITPQMHIRCKNTLTILIGCLFFVKPLSAQLNEWTWVKGSNNINQTGTYGTMGIPAASNRPGARDGALTWTDHQGNLWLMGGFGNGSSSQGILNDLWKFNKTSEEWIWMSGLNGTNDYGNYGMQGVELNSNLPGARYTSVTWTDKEGNLWLFGGNGNDETNTGDLNDLWKYNVNTNNWVWMKGSTIKDQDGQYGVQGLSDPNNTPGARRGAIGWTDKQGDFWLMGGFGYSNGQFGLLNDLWKYSVTMNQWTWIAGTNLINQFGLYGTKNIASINHLPGGRYGSVSFSDISGNLWLMGGFGYADSSFGWLNDLWKYSTISNEWTWVSGSKSVNDTGTFGIKGVPAANNTPDARYAPCGWADSANNLWILGGSNISSTEGLKNDLWRYNVQSQQWTWMSGDSLDDQTGVYGSLGVSNINNKPGSRFSMASWHDVLGNLWLFGGNGFSLTGNGRLSDLWKYSICLPPPTPGGNTTQTFCVEATIANLNVSGTDIKWYDSAVAGNLLSPSTILQNGKHYYASSTDGACVSTIRLDVLANIHFPDNEFSIIQACDSYNWAGTSYTTNGLYTKTFSNVWGCDSIHNLLLIISQSDFRSNSATACNQYTWTGTTYTNSGVYTKTFTNSMGCDSIHTVYLTIQYSNSGSSSVLACNEYNWMGSTYTTSGIYTNTFTNSMGCDSLHTLNLTIHYSNAGSSSATSCNEYSWTGSTYTTSGIYSKTFTNIVGCDSVHTLNLTVNYSNAGSSSLTSCNEYSWTGSTYTISGIYTKTFTNSQGCDSVHTLDLSINYANSSFTNIQSLGCYTWNTSGNSYTVSGVYEHHLTNAMNCDSTAYLNLTITNGINIISKAVLGGPYILATGLMQDSLRTMGLIPTTEPYSQAPYNQPKFGGPAGETINPTVLSTSGNNAIVDWVVLELRSGTNPLTIVANKRALIQRDGDIVSHVDGVSPVFIPNLPSGNYYLSVKHRNHLGVMTKQTNYFEPCAINNVDFSSADSVFEIVTIGPSLGSPRKQIGTSYALWPGDVNINKNVKYNGSNNDKDLILFAVGSGNTNGSLIGYRREDVNMDGKVRYNNTDNDRSVILNNAGVSTPNVVYYQHTPN